jgi:hypothetical protein
MEKNTEEYVGLGGVGFPKKPFGQKCVRGPVS